MTDEVVTRLYPAPMVSAALRGLYLREDLRRQGTSGQPFVYTNFIASLDGRVAVRGDGESTAHIPPSIANKRDWRLYQELAAQADVIVVSAAHARAMADKPSVLPFPFLANADTCDLKTWRQARGRAENPAVAVVTSTLDLPFDKLLAMLPHGFLCLTGAASLHSQPPPDIPPNKNIRILQAGPDTHVTGKGLVRALGDEGFRAIYSVAGPGVMKALLHHHVLDRLYLTQVSRLIGGASFDTLVESTSLAPPVNLAMSALYQDDEAPGGCAQTFATFDVERYTPRSMSNDK